MAYLHAKTNGCERQGLGSIKIEEFDSPPSVIFMNKRIFIRADYNYPSHTYHYVEASTIYEVDDPVFV